MAPPIIFFGADTNKNCKICWALIFIISNVDVGASNAFLIGTLFMESWGPSWKSYYKDNSIQIFPIGQVVSQHQFIRGLTRK